MKLRAIVSFAVFTCLLYFTPVHAGAIPSTGTTEVYFPPNGGATETVVSEISKAKQEILVQAYSFTSKPIAKALLDARKRGVSVEAVLDRSNVTGKYSAATFLFNSNVPVMIDAQHAITHNKVMISTDEEAQPMGPADSTPMIKPAPTSNPPPAKPATTAPKSFANISAEFIQIRIDLRQPQIK